MSHRAILTKGGVLGGARGSGIVRKSEMGIVRKSEMGIVRTRESRIVRKWEMGERNC